VSGAVTLDPALADTLAAVTGAGRLPTAAGHDAGVLAAHVPTGMLHVRNPTGVSHAPDEHAEDADADTGVRALADVLEELCR
jgi:beta-ureidopropionase / N-carbamoyl-L-amino-acid hydrolase